jgi:hypothetical protein
VPVPPQQPIPQQQPNIPAPAQRHPAYVNTQLRDFWPPLPWPEEPDLARIYLATMRDDPTGKLAMGWLATKPYMYPSNDETGWRGVKTLGVGGYCAAGLWIKSCQGLGSLLLFLCSRNLLWLR